MHARALCRYLAAIAIGVSVLAPLPAIGQQPALSPVGFGNLATTHFATGEPSAAAPVLLASAVNAGYFDAQAPQALAPREAPSRVQELEQRLADVEARLANQTQTSVTEQTAAPAQAIVVGSNLNLIPTWNNGLEFQTPNKDFRIRVGGRAQLDFTEFDQSSPLTNTPRVDGGVGPNRPAVDFRRARFRIDGTMHEVIGWAAEFDFSNMVTVSEVAGNPPGQPALAIAPSITDLYVTVMKLPIAGNFRIGNFKEPIGFEHLTSSRWMDWMERTYNQDAFWGPFNNGFMPGMMVFNWADDEMSTWALWAGPNQSNIFGYHLGNDWAGTMRGTHLLYYDEASGGRYLMHLGGSASIRDPDQGQARVRARGDVRSGPPSPINPIYADTGSFAADKEYLLNIEWFTVMGSWTFQAEYTASFFNGADINPLVAITPPAQVNVTGPQDLYFQGGYVEALYFLTGEHRVYDRRAGNVDRVIPNENFFRVRTADGGVCSGWGAWQVGVRYNALDLNSQQFNGGILNSMTLGLNWFLSANLKVQFNYDFTHRSEVDLCPAGNINSFGTRVAFDF